MNNLNPASRLEIPKHFGRRPDAVFLPPMYPDDSAITAAARLQHDVSVAVLDELARRDLTLTWLASEAGETADHIRRKLYGQVTASLHDLYLWSALLSISVEFEVNRMEDAR